MPVVGTSHQVRGELKDDEAEMSILPYHAYRKSLDCRTGEVVEGCPCLRFPLPCQGNHSTVSILRPIVRE